MNHSVPVLLGFLTKDLLQENFLRIDKVEV
jgi:hypothetical protein